MELGIFSKQKSLSKLGNIPYEIIFQKILPKGCKIWIMVCSTLL